MIVSEVETLREGNAQGGHGGRAVAGAVESNWRRDLQEEMARAVADGRWGRALRGVAWVHLGCFLVCHILFDPAIRGDLIIPFVWGLELAAVLGVLRWSVGPGWYRESAAVALVAKFWTTFLILSFNVAALNTLSGLSRDWFKPVWGTLSTFFFASLAWLFNPWFFAPAVQMWATGLVMTAFPRWNYLIYGVSWWIALQGVGWWLSRPRRGAGVILDPRSD